MRHENHRVSRLYYENLGRDNGERFAADNEILRKSVLPLLVRRVKGRVLCMGWSSTLKFTPPGVQQLVIADFAVDILKSVPSHGNAARVCADACLLPFDRGVFDTVFMLGILHHLTEDNTVETDKTLHKTMLEIARVMNRNSRLYVLEPFVSPFLEVVNRSVYFPARVFMNRRGLPMMCFFSIANFKILLEDAGLDLIYTTPIGMSGAIPVSWFLPSRKIEYRGLPQKISLLEIKKGS